ncbi:hypothetical protein [Actinoplanes xinjiangensis]|uniref:Uncharacterized protein n=1 Tax=Actinoplanes xinjiangensis TaxID=512350 RepID=A0A316EE90_9ACTN|nr:hypothetical protein [Actinoplanes xinjiangensis]PWK26974.1 hypothetical protein BC793_15713 [Actinoplanes xinjiangensis]GIF45334.1 hypothetical protein Axi01nite_96450 [Actinoplanes xinjiangensis]
MLDTGADAALLAAAADLAAGGLRVLAIATAVSATVPEPEAPPPLDAAAWSRSVTPLRGTARHATPRQRSNVSAYACF